MSLFIYTTAILLVNSEPLNYNPLDQTHGADRQIINVRVLNVASNCIAVAKLLDLKVHSEAIKNFNT